MTAPVAFIIFNRRDVTARVFAEIARARPERLLIIADGPRPGRHDDIANCAATRAVVERIDWPCEVLTTILAAVTGLRRGSVGYSSMWKKPSSSKMIACHIRPFSATVRSCLSITDTMSE